MMTPDQLADKKEAIELTLRFQPQQLSQDERDWLREKFKEKLAAEKKSMTDFLKDNDIYTGPNSSSMLSHVLNGSGNYREYILAIAEYIAEN